MKFCPYCGKENPGDYNFCSQCQKPLPGGEHSVQPNVSRQETPPPPPPRQVHYQQPTPQQYPPQSSIITEQDRQLAEKYALYGIIWGLLGLLIFPLFGIGGIHYGRKAKKLDPTKGSGGIILGVVGIVLGFILLFLLLMIIGI